jgi:hypothetical protein
MAWPWSFVAVATAAAAATADCLALPAAGWWQSRSFTYVHFFDQMLTDNSI